MKKIITLLVVAITVIANINAQMVEYYDNPQRFLFSGFDNHNEMRPTIMQGVNNDTTVFFSRKYALGSHRIIYGVAIPLYGINLDGTISQKLKNIINYYDTSGCSVILGNASHNSDHEYELLAKLPIRLGSTCLTGNYFKMPDSDSAYFASYSSSTLFNVLEIYFDQPKTVNSNYIVGCVLSPNQVPAVGGITNIFYNVLLIGNVQAVEEATYATIEDYQYLNTSNSIYGYPYIPEDSWGGPFPIITPPPCMPPVFMKVDEQHHKGATISWRVQYGTAYSEVEYGPQGFAEGTGTLASPIIPDADYNSHLTIDSLQMDADYTVRVRSYCSTTEGFSDWTEMDFHTGSFYIVSTSVNSDTCGEVRGGGTYPADTTIRLYAYPRNHKPFLNWSDGSTQNPRIVTVNRDSTFHAIFDCKAGTEGIDDADFMPLQVTITPNPTEGVTAIRCNAPIISWTLYDMKGCTLKSDSPGSENAIVVLSALPPAIYIISVKTDYGYTTKKIIVK